PVSTSEWIASLTIAELPVRPAAANFVRATRTLPSKAAYTTFFDDRRAMMSLVRSRRPGLLVPCPIRRQSRHPEIPVDLVHVLPDGEPRMLGRPAELLAQNRSDDRGRFLRRSPAEELQADASRQHILDGDRHVTGALDDFGANGRKTLDDGLGEISVFLGDIQDLRRVGAESSRQVLRSLLGNAVIPDQAHPVDRRETIRTGQGAISRQAWSHRQTEIVLDGIDGVLGHCPVCCPLPSHDADQTTARVNLQLIVTGEFLGFTAAAAAYQRPRSGETADDLAPGDGLFQVLVELAKNEVDFFLRYAELIIQADLLFRGADQQPSHPRDGKQDAPVFCLRDQHRVLAGKDIQRQRMWLPLLSRMRRWIPGVARSRTVSANGPVAFTKARARITNVRRDS